MAFERHRAAPQITPRTDYSNTATEANQRLSADRHLRSSIPHQETYLHRNESAYRRKKTDQNIFLWKIHDVRTFWVEENTHLEQE